MRPVTRAAWLCALGTVVVILTLVLGRIIPSRPAVSGASQATRPLDGPDSAARYAAGRRAPLRPGVDAAALYDRAVERRALMPRFSSRLGRRLPDGQAHAQLWLAAGRAVAVGQGSSPLALLDGWTPLGPGNIGGRTRIIRYHPTRHSTLFAAGVSGGVWRSDDDGGSWRPTSEGLTTLAVNAFAIDPSQPDVMYAGTGEGYFREDIRGTGLPLRGGGIFKTSDGGASWQRLASTTTPDFEWVNDLEVGNGNPRRIYAATRTGLWRSSDDGLSWTPLLQTTVQGGCLNLAMRPGQPDDLLFASCGTFVQATVYRFLRASAGSNAEVVLQEPGMGRTSLAIAPSNPDIVYALAASNDPGPGGNYQQALLAVYRSDRGGAAGTWQAQVTNADGQKMNTLLLSNVVAATIAECFTQRVEDSFINMGWYANVIAVDPRDPNRVWAAGVDWFRSDDGGRTWGIASSENGQPGLAAYAHVDQHAITFHPDYDGERNQVAIIGNDGGLFRTANARGRLSMGPRAVCPSSVSAIEVTWESLDRDYGVTQFYYGLPYPDGARYLGGAQDNSTLIGSDQDGSNNWRSTLGGDGGYVAIQPSNPQVVYAESQNGNIAKSADGGNHWTFARRGLEPSSADTLGPSANYLFVTPFVMDPSNAQRLWLGGEFLYQTANGAGLWTKASTAMPDGGRVSTILVAGTDSNRVVAGTNKGDVVSSRRALSANSSTSWEVSRARDGWVTSVAFDPRSPDIVYATYGNFGGQHVFRTSDGGVTWQSLDGDGPLSLPDIPVHCIVIDTSDPARLYLATDLGLFISTEGGGRWMVEETGFGAAVTEWLALRRDVSGRRQLFAFTHGRGAWRVELR